VERKREKERQRGDCKREREKERERGNVPAVIKRSAAALLQERVAVA